MSTDSNLVCKSWYEETYGRLGFAAQRLYPNEELLRFFGRHYFPLPPDQRQKVRVLEAGCGSGANLWMIAREGFDTHGIDLSPEGVALCEKMLAHWGTTATVKAADMTAIPYPDRHFDVVLDVFSAYCLNENGFMRFLDEVVRLLRGGGGVGSSPIRRRKLRMRFATLVRHVSSMAVPLRVSNAKIRPTTTVLIHSGLFHPMNTLRRWKRVACA